jgi:hypothetical protein
LGGRAALDDPLDVERVKDTLFFRLRKTLDSVLPY